MTFSDTPTTETDGGRPTLFPQTWIEIMGARTHNLCGIDVRIPHGKIVAFTGVSGSGKSSLAIDTLHAEARLRYVEGFDPYVRMFLTPRDRPQFDRIRGLTATLAVDQRNANRNPNSTLGTMTGVQSYLGLVFARLGPLSEGSRWTGTTLHPAQFDPYSREGICGTCLGAREIAKANPDLIVSRPNLPLLDGGSRWFGQNLSNEAVALPSLARLHGADLSRPWRDQPEAFRVAVLQGTDGEPIDVVIESRNEKKKTEMTYKTQQVLSGAIAEIERSYAAAHTPAAKAVYIPFLDRRCCPECDGTGLGELARTVTLCGATFRDVTEKRVADVREWIDTVAEVFNDAQREVGEILVPEFQERLDLLMRLGLGHLELGRIAPSLSGGERQRARLSAQISTALTGLTYILDEPGAGLHPLDKDFLFEILRELRDAGNTVLLVEHDPSLIARADWIIDLGPGGGRNGGRLIASGPPEEIRKHPKSLTGRYLRNPGYRLDRPLRPPDDQITWLKLHGAAAHNVKADTIRIPLNRLTCLTGMSGSGKSSVLNDILAQSVVSALSGKALETVGDVDGLLSLKWVEVVDQMPIGRTPRSNPATYTKAFDLIRQLFARTDAAKRLGLDAASFSFNAPIGRCKTCQGMGKVKLDMHFLGDTYLTCPKCDGRRYQPEILSVSYRGLAIDEVLDSTAAEAVSIFDAPDALAELLQAIVDVGLGYLKLGQSGMTLSGGEAQRLRLAKAAVRGGRGDNFGLVILDEPVTGLHPEDAQKLIGMLNNLLERGHTVVIAEHDIHAAASADWIIDMGPGAGESGGRIINEGTPSKVANGTGPTAPYLREIIRPQA